MAAVLHESSSLIGVAISLGGNVLISLALNIQKLAHQRHANSDEANDEAEGSANGDADAAQRRPIHRTRSRDSALSERTALLVVSPSFTRAAHNAARRGQRQTVQVAVLPADRTDLRQPPGKQRDHGHSHDNGGDGKENGEEEGRPYLRSKLWWLGLLLLTAGEAGNFISYGFAPASIVAPLGSVALVSNCFLAPWLLKERFRWTDLQGVLLCIVGATVVVISSKQSDVKLDPDELGRAIARPAFIAYASVVLALILLFATLSRRSVGERYIFVDLGVCALTGGFTVLSAKALASFLQLMFLDCLKYWITYAVIAILAVTAIVQINFLNKSLSRFDSRQVVPTQFVAFTIAAIVGSAVLFEEFKDTTFSKALNFLFGCAIVFTGVAVLTRDDDEDSRDDSEERERGEEQEGQREQTKRPQPLQLGVVTEEELEGRPPSKTDPVQVAHVTGRLRRTGSSLTAPRSLSASAGYLLLGSPSGKSPQKAAQYYERAEEDSGDSRQSPSKRSLV